MVGPRLRHVARSLLETGSRRGLLRLFAVVPLAGGLASMLGEQSVRGQGNVAGVGDGGGKRHRRRADRRHDPGSKRRRRNRKHSANQQCARSGQAPKKNRPCCKNLIKDATGRCGVASPACGTGGPCLVFLTSTVQQGSLGGLTGADGICQLRAQAAGLPGAYKAWLSDSTQSPASRFVQSPGLYRRVDGVTVANNWADLVDGTLAAPITVAENGAVFNDLALRSWTHTLANGTAGGVLNAHCVNWTSALNTEDGDEGQVVATDANWTDFAAGTCNNDFHLYCFQQS